MATVNAASNYLEEALANHVLNNTTYTSPTTVYLALFTSPVTDADLEAGTLTNEVGTSGTAYARQAISFNAATNPGGVCTNDGVVTFPTATAAWGTVTHFAIMDGDTEGADNVLIYGELDNSKVVDIDDVFQLPDTNLSITFA